MNGLLRAPGAAHGPSRPDAGVAGLVDKVREDLLASYNVPREEAERWLDAGVHPADVTAWTHARWTPERARVFVAAGLGPRGVSAYERACRGDRQAVVLAVAAGVSAAEAGRAAPAALATLAALLSADAPPCRSTSVPECASTSVFLYRSRTVPQEVQP